MSGYVAEVLRKGGAALAKMPKKNLKDEELCMEYWIFGRRRLRDVRGYRQPGYRVIYTGKAEAKILLMMQFLLLELNSGGAIMIAFSYPVQVEYSHYTCVKSYVICVCLIG